ncbi:head-tail connector protein [Moraxella haemolytica]|uniref:head-tail connector protein n=1 Tax=Moraxella haemolytica TaxID=2904119 RepID=UPI002543417F|nr:head-tail connector protein [Moraxella sp. ZY171148]WII95002.1 head-tail connector protein [Moraxella sp. ZY171148]
MNKITLEQVKHQCRIEHDDEDPLLTLYINSAYRAVEKFTDKTLFFDDIPIDSDKERCILLSDDINQACLMLIAHWYANRETVGANMVNIAKMPYAVDFLLSPYRFMGV